MIKYELGTKLERESDGKVFEIVHIGKEMTDPKMRVYRLLRVGGSMPFSVLRRNLGMSYAVLN